ncbi:hypothetical protein B0H14DRAFT_1563405 [Mycena olivaceomarginata]|nr:hypothetical protein B0H14DRAFT_1563405 [Mycena olivaceomarginata]
MHLTPADWTPKEPIVTTVVVDPATVPKAVSKERPASKKSTMYAIRFFPGVDYAPGSAQKRSSRLTRAQIDVFIGDAGAGGGAGRTAGDLMEGYRKALDSVTWVEEHFTNLPATKKLKSKSKLKKREDGDKEGELVGDEEKPEEEAKEKANKKRKRASSACAREGEAQGKGQEEEHPDKVRQDQDEQGGGGEQRRRGRGRGGDRGAGEQDVQAH